MFLPLAILVGLNFLVNNVDLINCLLMKRAQRAQITEKKTFLRFSFFSSFNVENLGLLSENRWLIVLNTFLQMVNFAVHLQKLINKALSIELLLI